ncbi:flagellar basal body P-ring formation chaperone FlgA [Legionella fairfieldensis]|uniref:flagellar basal body P-ring formation chaperone FlgA n=1 Tax=Legionella fairfieldensis TaxID=45064 RepID=UPI000490D3D8|nr:flagellar basal body P-ring formation chaperone FlgA [Legionella fairfieldensis]
MKFAISLFLLMINWVQAQTNPLNQEISRRVVLRFRPLITTEATTLGDLLIIKNDRLHWEKLALDSHPKADDSLSREALIQWMQKRLGSFDWQWQGINHTTVKAINKTSKNSLLKKAQQDLAKELTPLYSRIELTPLNSAKNSIYSIESFHTRIKLTFPIRKRVCVWLTNSRQSIPVWFSVKAYQTVRVANHALPAHSIVHDNDFSWQERNIAGLRAEPAKNLNRPVWLKTSVPAHTILVENNLGDPPQIIHGQKVMIKVYERSITIATEALALNDGHIGQLITVRNPATQKTFSARVVGNQQAEIRL